MAEFADILSMRAVTRTVSRVASPGDVVSKYFGFEIGSSKLQKVPLPGLSWSYDIYDANRNPAKISGPYDSASTVPPNPVGSVSVGLIRSALKVPLEISKLSRIRTVGTSNTLDDMGKDYMARQAGTLREQQSNLREIIASAGIFHGGKMGIIFQGTDRLPTFQTSGVNQLVNWAFPASNIQDSPTVGTFADAVANQPLTMGPSNAPGQPSIIATPWSDITAPIPTQLVNISNGFQRQVGMPLKRIFCDPVCFMNVLQNNAVRQLAGTANMSFAAYDAIPLKDGEGNDTDMAEITIKGLPFYTFVTYNGVLNVPTVANNGTITYSLQQMMPPNYATFTAEPSQKWLSGVEGSEYVMENDWQEPKLETGFTAWVRKRADPATFELHTLQLFGLEINRPGAIAWARVQ